MSTHAIGRYRVTGLRDRDFRLDGGAMFGVVPRVIWQALEPPDPEDHTVPLATRPLLIEGAACGPIVLEPGIGGAWDVKRKRIHRIADAPTVEASLADAGLSADDVRVVLLTHFHWDHAGASVKEDSNGRLTPVFPRARHVVPRVELDACLARDGLRRASYRAEIAETLAGAGLLDPFEGDALDVAPGVRLHRLGGHSDGVCVATIEDGGEVLAFWSDVVPTRHHVNPLYIMAYDQNAERSHAVRRPWIERAAAEGWINALYHDPLHGFVRFTRAIDRWGAVPA
jgi:glyoxylase-like metal-dependent hydrolase (beta-lactamase superfamily II)